jgi:hypothetical protein
VDTPNLPQELQQALEQEHGCVIRTSYVLMSIDVYRKTMGMDSDEDLAASLESIDQAMKDLDAGRTIPLHEAQRRLDDKYGV